MIGWVRNIVIILVLLTIIYVMLSIASRFKQRQKLKTEYKTANTDAPQDEYIATGMTKYEKSLKPKLFIGVYLIPIMIISVLIYFAQT